MDNNNIVIKTLLNRFQELWDESLVGNYSNRNELANLARQIRDMKCSDEFLISSLTTAERKTYHCAILIANIK